jgi:uncharacterized protein YbjT (DUF2867 family)
MTILVTGAPGNVGTEVVRQLVQQGIPLRVGAYDVEHARETFGDDVEIVRFDFLDPATYRATFAGVERMFLVRPPALSNVQRDIAPAVWAAVGAGVQQIVFLSIQGVEQNRVVPHYKIEQLILETGVDYTFLRASFFMQNLTTTHREEIRTRNEIALPVGDAKTSFIDARDIAAVAARALSEDGHANQKYTLTGPDALDYHAVAQVLTRTLNRPIHYTRPSVFSFVRQQMAAGRPLMMTLVMTALYTITRFGNARQVTDDVAAILGRAPITFEQFAADHKAVWLLDEASSAGG